MKPQSRNRRLPQDIRWANLADQRGSPYVGRHAHPAQHGCSQILIGTVLDQHWKSFLLAFQPQSQARLSPSRPASTLDAGLPSRHPACTPQQRNTCLSAVPNSTRLSYSSPIHVIRKQTLPRCTAAVAAASQFQPRRPRRQCNEDGAQISSGGYPKRHSSVTT